MDDNFGPRLFGHFDFTLLFEDAIFHIIPSGIVILSTLFFVAKIKNTNAAVRAGRLLWGKLALALALTVVQVAIAILWMQFPQQSTSRLSHIASILTAIASLCVGIILYANHVHFTRPLPFLGVFLMSTLLLDIATTRTYFRRSGLLTIARLHVSIPILKLMILLSEEVSKRSLVISPTLRDSLGSESFAGFLNKSLFLWLNPVMLFGMRGRITTDFLPGVSRQVDAVVLYNDFMAIWSKTDQTTKYALVKSCLLTVPWPYIYVILPRLLFIGFKFAQPFLLQDVVNAVSLDVLDSDFRMSLILATALVYIGMAVCIMNDF